MIANASATLPYCCAEFAISSCGSVARTRSTTGTNGSPSRLATRSASDATRSPSDDGTQVTHSGRGLERGPTRELDQRVHERVRVGARILVGLDQRAPAAVVVDREHEPGLVALGLRESAARSLRARIDRVVLTRAGTRIGCVDERRVDVDRDEMRCRGNARTGRTASRPSRRARGAGTASGSRRSRGTRACAPARRAADRSPPRRARPGTPTVAAVRRHFQPSASTAPSTSSTFSAASRRVRRRFTVPFELGQLHPVRRRRGAP